MAKGKNLNPADAFRKAQRKKELKKNKTERSKARDFALVKKDTKDLEEEIEKLEAKGDDADKAQLSKLKSELEKIMAKKEEYVAEHPEHRRLVYKGRKQEKNDDAPEEKPLPAKRNIFNKHGLPRHPERSVYYDPVMNPYGVPPPGMPYVERPLRPDEVDSDADPGDDDDIAMPEGPPPGSSETPVDSDDDIVMPEGPPPGQELDDEPDDIPVNPPLPPGPPPLPVGLPPPPPSMLPLGFAPLPPPPPGPPPMNQFIPPNMPFPPPPPPPGFPPVLGMPNFPPPPPFGAMPPPPPGFFPGRHVSTSAMQDPLSSIPHQTYQAHKATAHHNPPPHPSLPAKPTAAISVQVTAAATVSAAPQLRDFKKEATAFVPAALKRKKPGVSTGLGGKINAAPSLGAGESGEAVSVPARPDLLSTLKEQFGPAPGPGKVGNPSGAKGKAPAKKPDDYDKFMEEMGDIIGSK